MAGWVDTALGKLGASVHTLEGDLARPCYDGWLLILILILTTVCPL